MIAGSDGTTTEIDVFDSTLMFVVVDPPKDTCVAPSKLLPEIVTVFPPLVDPLFGDIELTVGADELPPNPTPKVEHALATRATDAKTIAALPTCIAPPG
jgi:hypothetical protein